MQNQLMQLFPILDLKWITSYVGLTVRGQSNSIRNIGEDMTNSVSKSLLMQLLFILSCVMALHGQPPEKLRIFHPDHDMFTYVNRMEASGEIPASSQLYIMDSLMTADSMGVFKYMIHLQDGVNEILMREVSPNQVKLDTFRVVLRRPDHMTADSVFINNNIPTEHTLVISSPRPGKTRSARIGMKGYTHPDATLLMGAETLKVWPSGAFTALLEIEHGKNSFQFRSILGEQILEQELLLDREPPEDPEDALLPRSAEPRRERWIQAGEYLPLSVRGPQGKQVYYRIPGVTWWTEMSESSPGIYTSTRRLLDIDHEINTKVEYRIGRFSFKKTASAALRIMTESFGGMTIDTDTRVYDTPDTDQLLFPMSDSVAVQIVGRIDNMYQIALGKNRTAFVRASLVDLDPSMRSIEPQLVGSLRSDTKGEWAEFRINTGKNRLPYSLKELALPSRVQLQIYGAKQGWEWTSYPDSSQITAYLERSQPGDLTWQMDFYPETRFWGWSGHYEGNDLVLRFRKAPEIRKENPFANIRIEIDPGHGGWERGARGSTGYAEADANLRYSLKLEKLLTDAGATVFLTRHEDRRLSLPERAQIARDDAVHIFVMAHNNAPGSSRDPMEAKGASTFFTWPSSKALSDHIYPHLGEMGIDRSGKISRYYYYLTRQTEYLVYLIEGAFMTYPPEEMFLMSEEGLDALALAAYRGLEDFVMSEAE
jgi:N-acetylmuramoyl-L-alanine amidase